MIRVVIADDQELVRAGFAMILEHNRIDVVAQAADGLEAVARTREFTPDIVLMDIRMPTLDGIEATRRITAIPRSTTRVLILTTFDLDEYVYGGASRRQRVPAQGRRTPGPGARSDRGRPG